MNAAADCLSTVRDIADMDRTPGVSFNADDTLSTSQRMRALCDMEREPSLEEAKEVPLYDMTEAELAVVAVQDPDVNVRREALRMYRREILLRAEDRIVKALTEARK